MDSGSSVTPVGLVKNNNGAVRKERRWVLLQGLAPPSRLGVFNNTVENGYRAFAERYFLCKTSRGFEPALASSCVDWSEDPDMQEFCELLHKHMCLAPTITIDEVVDLYKGTKHKVYVEARKHYWSDGLATMDAMLNSFVKFEKCDLGKAPRVINPRSPKYNLLLGKFLKLNEHNYFNAISGIFKQRQVVVKGVDTRQAAAILHENWDALTNPVAIGGDATKFDMHVSEAALKFEHLCYIRQYASSYKDAQSLQHMGIVLFRAGAPFSESWVDGLQLAWLLAGQLLNKGRAWFHNGMLKFKMRGTRASGDLNTSLGNCILMCAMTYGWMKRSQVRCLLSNNGDDCVYFLNAEDEAKWRDGFDEYYRRKGFRMVLEPTVSEFEEVEFCQARPVDVDGWTMVRNPKTLVTKASMCLLPVQNINHVRKWMMAVGIAEGSLGSGVPVIQSFARAMRRNGLRCTKRLIGAAYYQSSRIYHATLEVADRDVTAAARISFHAAWGVTPDEQIALEAHFDNWQMGKQFGGTIEGYEAVDRDAVHYASVTSFLA